MLFEVNLEREWIADLDYDDVVWTAGETGLKGFQRGKPARGIPPPTHVWAAAPQCITCVFAVSLV